MQCKKENARDRDWANIAGTRSSWCFTTGKVNEYNMIKWAEIINSKMKLLLVNLKQKFD